MTTNALPPAQPSPLSPCVLQWDESAQQTTCVNRTTVHRFVGHQRSLQPLLSEA